MAESRSDSRSLAVRLLYPILLPLSWVYCIGLKIYLLPYALGIRKQHRLPCMVVCVGNLTFGGTGKTPAVITLAKALTDKGLKVVLLSRGHGGQLSGKGAVVSDGGKRSVDWKDCGDEPALIADSLKGTPVVIGKNRVTMGRLAIQRFNPDIILMDDGMQYWQLHKDLTIALASSREPFGSGGVLPAGTLREPRTGLRRASAVIITGADQVKSEELAQVKRKLLKVHPDACIYTARHVPDRLYKAATGEAIPLDYLKGKTVAALSSIGSPRSFESTLETLGAVVKESLRFPDHHCYGAEDLRAISEKSSGLEIITTEKDMVRLPEDNLKDVIVLSVKLEISKMEELMDLICRNRRDR